MDYPPANGHSREEEEEEEEEEIEEVEEEEALSQTAIVVISLHS